MKIPTGIDLNKFIQTKKIFLFNNNILFNLDKKCPVIFYFKINIAFFNLILQGLYYTVDDASLPSLVPSFGRLITLADNITHPN